MSWPEFVVHKPLWWRLLILLALAYVSICLLLLIAQRRLIYLPSRGAVALPERFTEWRSANGEFWGYKRVASGAATNLACLFFFHGNGGNASGWAHATTEFPGDIFVLEYPGYGNRAGTPTERRLKQAALAGFEAEHARYETVVVCGQSLGSGVTEAIFTKHPENIDALVLITPFLSLSEMARAQFSWFPTKWILRDKMELYDAWLKFPGRSVVVVADRDEVIPSAQSLRYAAATNESRKVITLQASHNSIDLTSAFWRELLHLQ